MKSRNRLFIRCVLTTVASALCCSNTALSKPPPATTGHSFVNPNYQRVSLPNGNWEPETYAFGKGSMLDPSGVDKSLTALSFNEICQIIAGSLAEENYLPTPSPDETDLLILVSWGKTLPNQDGLQGISIDGMTDVLSTVQQIQTDIAIRDGGVTQEQISSGQVEVGPTDGESHIISAAEGQLASMIMMQSISDKARRDTNDHNARLLGYSPALSDAYQDALPVGISRSRLEDLISEIESPRYFVILQAYDFQKMWKENKKELQWMTRFSIRAYHRSFDEELDNMTSAVSSLFGQDGGKLKRNLRPGKIRMGEVEVIELVEEE